MSGPGTKRAIGSAWAALGLAALAWFGGHQLGSNLSFADCHANGALQVLLIGLVALALIVLGAWLSWGVWRARGPASEGRDFAALIGMLTAGLLAIAIVLQTVAGFIIPACFG